MINATAEASLAIAGIQCYRQVQQDVVPCVIDLSASVAHGELFMYD
jgi:hypothetical protein